MKFALVGLVFLASVSAFATPRFCVGDNVMDGHTQYHITAVYADGTADIEDTYGNFKNVSTNDLSTPLSNINGFTVRESVMLAHTSYTVIATYSDGTVDIEDTYGNYKNVSTTELTLPVTNVNGISVGEKVMLAHSLYTVVATYSDGTVDGEDGYGNYKNIRTCDLTMPITNVNGYCVGEKVMLGHTPSTVIAAYVDGTVDIEDAYGNYSNVSTNQLSLPEQCTGGCH